MRKTHSVAHDVAVRLRPRIADLAQDLIGQPQVRGRNVWRFGAKGSLVVNVAGTRAGRWYSFEEGRGGDALDLIAWARRTSLSDAIGFARSWIGPCYAKASQGTGRSSKTSGGKQ